MGPAHRPSPSRRAPTKQLRPLLFRRPYQLHPIHPPLTENTVPGHHPEEPRSFYWVVPDRILFMPTLTLALPNGGLIGEHPNTIGEAIYIIRHQLYVSLKELDLA